MEESYVMKCRVYAALAWIASGALLLGGWAMVGFDRSDWPIANGLFALGCSMAAVAATLHIRSFMVRIAAMMRRSGQMENMPSPLRPIGDNGRH